MNHYTIYIDEAGDEGIGKLVAGNVGGQSRWLILGACIVSYENDLKLPTLRDRILNRFPKKKSRTLHFRDLKHEQKIVACQEMATFQFGGCLALSHKVTIPGSNWEVIFKQKGFLYNYLIRWLLERLTAACRMKHAHESVRLKIVFSRRGGTDYHQMIEYFKYMRDGNEKSRPTKRIDWDMIDMDGIMVESHDKWAGLQISDCLTSAFFNAVEPNAYGNYETAYAMILKPRILKIQGNCLNAGLTPVPSLYKCNLDRQQIDFFASMRK